MNRRAFLILTGSLLAAPLAAGAQQAGRVYRIGFLRAGRPPDGFVARFKQGLQELGYVEGRNIIIEYRFTDGSIERLPSLVEELIRLKVDLILASAASAVLAAHKMTRTLPIIFVGVIDPEVQGIVSRLARPGGNITGLTTLAADLNGKRLEILKALLPGLERVAVFWNPANPTNHAQLTNTEGAARKLGVQVQPLPINTPADFEPAFKAARGAGALLQLDGPFLLTHRTRLVELAKKSRLPGIYGFKEVVEAGGLMSYGAHYEELYRRAATYVDKILKGTKPGDLPVEQPTKFELVINLKTAKALGLTIPPSLLQRADQVIE